MMVPSFYVNSSAVAGGDLLLAFHIGQNFHGTRDPYLGIQL